MADVVALNFRVPRKLHKRLEKAAKDNTTSINAEMVTRLERSFHYEGWQEQRERWLLAVTQLVEALPEAAVEIAFEQDMQRVSQEATKNPAE